MIYVAVALVVGLLAVSVALYLSLRAVGHKLERIQGALVTCAHILAERMGPSSSYYPTNPDLTQRRRPVMAPQRVK
jgi:hypothetical protein